MLLCEAAGFQNVFVETVGVGQSEVAVASGWTDFFLLLMIAGAGDELQGMKRGVLELRTWSRSTRPTAMNRIRAEAARKQLESAMSLFPPQPSGWRPPVVVCSARAGEGIAQIWETVLNITAPA
jgi:LAO/AO transport system kinase